MVEDTTVETMMEVNRLIEKAKSQDAGADEVRIPCADLTKICTVTFGDASFGEMQKMGSQGGLMTFCCETGLANGEVPAAMVE